LSRLFISHSSLNDDWALALQNWLIREGWSGENDIFLDLDPERGIAAGRRWARALEDAATRCEAVLFLVSEVWLASKWCNTDRHAPSGADSAPMPHGALPGNQRSCCVRSPSSIRLVTLPLL